MTLSTLLSNWMKIYFSIVDLKTVSKTSRQANYFKLNLGDKASIFILQKKIYIAIHIFSTAV